MPHFATITSNQRYETVKTCDSKRIGIDWTETSSRNPPTRIPLSAVDLSRKCHDETRPPTFPMPRMTLETQPAKTPTPKLRIQSRCRPMHAPNR